MRSPVHSAAIAAAAACAAMVACSARPAPPGPELQVTGDSTRLRRADPLPAASPIFDGETVHLRAARGETVGVTVWRRGTGEVSVALAIDAPDVAVSGFAVHHHRVRRPSTRMYGPSGGAGEWPDRLQPVTGPVLADRAAAFDLAIARDAAPGERRGTLTIGERRLPVVVRIEAATLPPLSDAPRVWAYYDPRELGRATGLTGDALIAAELRWSAMFRDHGVAASPDLGLDEWSWRREQVRGLRWVPVVLDRDGDLDAEVRGWADALAGTGQQPFAIPIDEPRRLAQKLAVRALADRIHAGAGGRESFLYAVTDDPHFVYGDAIDIYLSPFAVRLDAAREVGGRAVERWTYNGSPPFAGSMILDTDGVALRTWGWIAWRWRVPLWYVWDAAYWSDRHNHRRRGGRGLAEPSPVDSDAVTFDDGEDHGNLDGVLAWADPAGPAPTLRLRALRRGLQDRALLELLEACAGRPAAEAIAAELVPRALGDAGAAGASGPGSWPTDEAAWEAARQRLLDALAECR